MVDISPELSYYINKKLIKSWDKIRGGFLAGKDEDRVFLVDGRERTGKSVFTFQQAKYLDPTFDVSRVCFKPEEFLNCIRTAKKGQVIVFDEAFRGLSSKSALSKTNKAVVQAMMEMGQRNLIVFIVLPTFFLLEMYAAVLRSEALFHIYKNKKGVRKFRVYNYKKKAELYKLGKKKGFSYDWPKTKFRDRFFNIYAIDETSYRAKKEQALQDMDGTGDADGESKYQEKWYKTVVALRKELKLTEKSTSELLSRYQVRVGAAQVGEITRKHGIVPGT